MLVNKLWSRKIVLGVGIGLIISALIFLLHAPESNELTSQDIVNEAKKMGMITEAEHISALERSENELEGNMPVPESEERDEVEIVIPQGATASQVANILSDKGIIENEANFVEFVYLLSLEQKLKSGNYTFPQKADSSLVILALTGNN